MFNMFGCEADAVPLCRLPVSSKKELASAEWQHAFDSFFGRLITASQVWLEDQLQTGDKGVAQLVGGSSFM